MRAQRMSIIAVMSSALLIPSVSMGGADRPMDMPAAINAVKASSAKKTPLCRFVVFTNTKSQPYQCWNKCPSYTYKQLANSTWAGKAAYLCMPCHFVATGNKKKPFECSEKCPESTKERAVLMPKGGAYFACMNPKMPCFWMPTSNKYQPYVCSEDCSKGHHPEPTAWPNPDSFGCFKD